MSPTTSPVALPAPPLGADAAPRPAAAGAPARSPLAITAAAALLAVAAVKVYLARALDMPPMFAMGAVAGLLALAIVRGARWARAAGAAYAALLLAVSLQFIVPDLAHPGTPTFAPSLLLGTACALAVATGGAAAAEARRRAAPAGAAAAPVAPAWLAPLAAAAVAACVGAIAVSSVARAGSAATGLSGRALAALPAVTAERYAFAERELRVRAGQPVVLRVDNRDAVLHSFDVDAFDVHVPLPGRASTVVVFTAGAAGRYTVYCAPHYDRASGRGMRTTLVVEP
jgi:plastocyanin